MIDRGEMTWAKAMGLKACVVAVRYVKKFVPGCDLIVDPFCGKGSILAVANEFGLDSLGVEISTKRSKDALQLKTNTLDSEPEGKNRRKQRVQETTVPALNAGLQEDPEQQQQQQMGSPSNIDGELA